MKNTKGITLIALVITIIVLLILAGVSISAISGENGIVAKAKEASERTKEEEEKELAVLDGLEGEIDKVTNSINGKEPKLNEYGFYYDTFYVGTFYAEIFKAEISGVMRFLENNCCLLYDPTSKNISIYYWEMENDKIIIGGLMQSELTINNGGILESGTDSSLEIDTDYKIIVTKNEHGFYYDVVYFMKNKEIADDEERGKCIAATIKYKEDGWLTEEAVWENGKQGSSSIEYTMEDLTVSNNGKKIEKSYYINGYTAIYELPEDIYELQ